MTGLACRVPVPEQQPNELETRGPLGTGGILRVTEAYMETLPKQLN